MVTHKTAVETNETQRSIFSCHLIFIMLILQCLSITSVSFTVAKFLIVCGFVLRFSKTLAAKFSTLLSSIIVCDKEIAYIMNEVFVYFL